MFFKDYKKYPEANVRHSLLWEYDMDRFDWQNMRTVFVQRVVERGLMQDFYAILNLYGLKGVREAIKKEELACCKKTQSQQQPHVPLKALTFYNDINYQEPIIMMETTKFSWNIIEKRLMEMQRKPDQLFPPL